MSDFEFQVKGTVFITADDYESAEKIFEDYVFYAPFYFEVVEFQQEELLE